MFSAPACEPARSSGLDRAASLIEKPFTAEALTNRIREALMADTVNAGV